jgi:phosphate starvation-inducible PhoH-like protein
MGENSKFIITGDETQIDIANKHDSGLTHAMRILRGIENVAFIRFERSDVVRHKLVQKIIEAYDKN